MQYFVHAKICTDPPCKRGLSIFLFIHYTTEIHICSRRVVRDNRKTHPDEFSLTLPKKKILKIPYGFPAFWPLLIHLKLLENGEIFTAFFRDKTPMKSSLIWSAILDGVVSSMNITGSIIFILSTFDKNGDWTTWQHNSVLHLHPAEHVARSHQLFWLRYALYLC